MLTMRLMLSSSSGMVDNLKFIAILLGYGSVILKPRCCCRLFYCYLIYCNIIMFLIRHQEKKTNTLCKVLKSCHGGGGHKTILAQICNRSLALLPLSHN